MLVWKSETHHLSAPAENNLARLRKKRGLSAAELAKAAGISRQTIYAMEAGSYVPNTLVALKLARALEATVEDLFALPDSPAPSIPIEPVTVLPGSGPLESGQPVQLCRVGRRIMALAPSPVRWYFPTSDAVVAGRRAGPGKAGVRVLHPEADSGKRVLVAGCDPGISVLARHVRSAGIEVVYAHRNSSQALALLQEGWIHVAGTHLRDEASGESNIPQIARMFPGNSVAVVAFALWEEGIVVARGNPKSIRGIEDLARAGVSIVNREPGAGSRMLLDAHLERLGLNARNVAGYERIAPGHLPAAWQVQSGAADCCIATRAAARVFGLGFIPLAGERYDLVVRRQHLDLPGIQALFDTITQSGFRRELESLSGYDTGVAGRRIR